MREGILTYALPGSESYEWGTSTEIILMRTKIPDPESFLKQFTFWNKIKGGVSLFLDFCPFVGNLKGLVEGIVGYDLAGNKLSATDRVLGAFGPVGKIRKVSKILKIADKVIEMHHLLPQAKRFRKFFKAAGLDIEDFKIPLDKAKHRLKPGGIHTIDGGNWNKEWDDFMEQFPNANKEQILEHLEKLRAKFGI